MEPFPQSFPLYAAWKIGESDIEVGAVIYWVPIKKVGESLYWDPVVAIYNGAERVDTELFGFVVYGPTPEEARKKIREFD